MSARKKNYISHYELMWCAITPAIKQRIEKAGLPVPVRLPVRFVCHRAHGWAEVSCPQIAFALGFKGLHICVPTNKLRHVVHEHLWHTAKRSILVTEQERQDRLTKAYLEARKAA